MRQKKNASLLAKLLGEINLLKLYGDYLFGSQKQSPDAAEGSDELDDEVIEDDACSNNSETISNGREKSSLFFLIIKIVVIIATLKFVLQAYIQEISFESLMIRLFLCLVLFGFGSIVNGVTIIVNRISHLIDVLESIHDDLSSRK